ncbi:MAG TPA: GAF domain-containing protein [Actinomycetes bacterium]|nr:GAF domain-containing protein [Actinomycetes bacterium]
MADWLLVETFGGDRREPTVLAVGSGTRNMVPLSRILGRGRNLGDVRDLIATVVQSATTIHTTTADGSRQMIGHPLCTYGGRVHGVYVWVGQHDEVPPPRDPAGAWHVNMTHYISSRSDDLLALFHARPGNRQHVHSLAELFAGRLASGRYGRLTTNTDEAAALAKLVDSRAGDEHQATWTATRDDDEKRAVNFAFRTLAEPNENREMELVARGITHDIGPAESTAAAPSPRPILLAELVIAAEQTPGRWRAIVNLHTLRLLRWLDEPMPDVVWEYRSPYPPAIHRRDLRKAVEVSRELANSGHVTTELRFRATDGGWTRLVVHARLMLLNQHTTAALVTLSRPATNS